MWKHIVYGTDGNTRVIILCENMQGGVYFAVRDLDRRTINDAVLLKEWVKDNINSLAFRKLTIVHVKGAQGMARKLKEVGWDHVFIYEESIMEKITNRVVNLEPV